MNAPRPTLDGVTLVCIDTDNVALALRALERSRAACIFTRTLLFTADAVTVPDGIEVVRIPPIRDRRDYARIVIKGLPRFVNTAHVLIVRWDGFVAHAEAWDPAFLEYDSVGDRGFSLRSKRLLDALLDDSFAEDTLHDDDVIDGAFRPRLEAEFGIRFAPAALTSGFARAAATDGEPTFGFHGAQNLWQCWSEADIDFFLRHASRPTLRTPAVTALARHLVSVDRTREAAKVAAGVITEVPDDPDALDILAGVRDRTRRHDYGSRAEQRFFFGLLKRHLPECFRERQVLEIGRAGAEPVTKEWFEDSRFVAAWSGGDGPGMLAAASESFDTIISAAALEHLPEAHDAVENALRMLKPDGLLVIACAGHGRHQHDTARYPAPDGRNGDHYRNLAPDDFAGVDFDRHLAFWVFLEDRVVHDLYFVGVGRAASADLIARARRLVADNGFLLKRKNVFGIY
ncbi:MAG: methyltransferase domain-containing protein [Burkholderiales bacterium]|nr:methyltransferase domain-containing protein [Burkholderiales bacterium]